MSKKTGSSNDHSNDRKVLGALLSATDEIIDAVQQFGDRFTSKGNSFSVSDAMGQEGEVSVAIPKGGTGEVILSMGQSLHNYPARGLDASCEFKRGTRVKVRELASHTLLVEASGKQK